MKTAMQRVMAFASLIALSSCGPTTVGDSCDLLGNTVCGRCFPTEKADCLAGFFSTCCIGTTCEMPVRSPASVIQ